MHRTIEEAFLQYNAQGVHPFMHTPIVHVPGCSGYISKKKRENIGGQSIAPKRLPLSPSPEDVLRSERIPPIHLAARHVVTNQYMDQYWSEENSGQQHG